MLALQIKQKGKLKLQFRLPFHKIIKTSGPKSDIFFQKSKKSKSEINEKDTMQFSSFISYCAVLMAVFLSSVEAGEKSHFRQDNGMPVFKGVRSPSRPQIKARILTVNKLDMYLSQG